MRALSQSPKSRQKNHQTLVRSTLLLSGLQWENLHHLMRVYVTGKEEGPALLPVVEHRGRSLAYSGKSK